MQSDRNEVNIGMAKDIIAAFGFEPKMVRHYDSSKDNSVDILSIEDPLDKTKKFHCTIGLSDILTLIKSEKQNFGVEVFLVDNQKLNFGSELLSTCAFYIGKDKWEARPGAVFNDLITLYDKNLDMKHIYFTEPFLWEDKLKQISDDVKGKNVLFLLGVPISGKELEYKEQYGDEKLEELLFSDHEIDLFDFKRKSVV